MAGPLIRGQAVKRAILLGGHLPELLGLLRDAVEAGGVTSQPEGTGDAARLGGVSVKNGSAFRKYAGRRHNQVRQQRRKRNLDLIDAYQRRGRIRLLVG